MSSIKQKNGLATPLRRAATIVEIEIDLVGRFQRFLRGWADKTQDPRGCSEDQALIQEFVGSFVENFHFLRIETVLFLCEEAGNRRLSLWWGKFVVHQDRIRDRLEGMRRAASSEQVGAHTAFLWASTALCQELKLYLRWSDRVLLPELRACVSPELDALLASRLELDQAEELTHYAQAESTLLLFEADQEAEIGAITL